MIIFVTNCDVHMNTNDYVQKNMCCCAACCKETELSRLFGSEKLRSLLLVDGYIIFISESFRLESFVTSKY